MSSIMKGLVDETEAIKGADGKRCWKGKRYAGTVNGKDKCIPVKNESAYEKDLDDNEPRTVIGVYGAKSKEFRKKFANQKAQDRFFDHPDREGNYEIHYVQKVDEAANPAQQAAIAVNMKKQGKKPANEGVIVGHDAKDPEIAILGGAGTMNLSKLKNKAAGEAQSLYHDMVLKGNYKAAAYNIKQLVNTLNTIVAAEEEMSKKYFGEARDDDGYTDYDYKASMLEDLGQQISSLAEEAYGLVRGTPEESRARSYWYPHIVTAVGGDHGFMGGSMYSIMDTVSALYEAGEDEDIDEARQPSDALRAAQKNLVDLSTGEVRRREAAKKAAAKREREYAKQAARDARPKKPTLDQIWQRVEHAISNYFPDGDPTDYLNPYMQKTGITWDDITRAAKKNGYKDLWDYWNALAQDIENDAYYDWHATGGKNVRHRVPFMETPTDNPTGASGEGGWRKYKPKSAGTVEEDTAYAGGMGQGGGAGQSQRKFKPKSAGTFKEEQLDEGQYEMMLRNGQVKKFVAKDDADAKRIAAGHDAKSVIKLKGGVPAGKVTEEQLDEKCWDTHKQVGMKKKGDKMVPNCVPKESAIMKGLKR